MTANGNGQDGDGDKLGLLDAVAMAVGAMVGGGIFAVLGESVSLGGNAAFIGFGLAGALALITGVSYSRLTLSFDEAGGSFSYVEELVGPRAAGTVSWFLLTGYVFTMSLYAHTFGSYADRLFGLPRAVDPFAASALALGLAAVNLAGVRQSAITEDILVYMKLGILVVVAGAGFFLVKSSEALPILNRSGPMSVVTAGALIFVAYEGFETLAYDYDDLKDHHRNLPRAIWLAIPLVTLLYIAIAFVTTGTLDAATIEAHGETVLAYVAQPIFGRLGLVAVMVAAMLSTASAVNATIFATGRLAKRIAGDHELPGLLTRRQLGGAPLYFTAGTAIAVSLVQFGGSLSQITTFASLTFLLVYAIVNLAAVVHHDYAGLALAIPSLGTAGCVASAGLLLWYTYQHSPDTLWLLAIFFAIIIALRLWFVFGHHEFLEKLESK